MRKVLTALAGATLVVTLSAPVASAAASMPAHHRCYQRCNHGIVSSVLDWLL